MSEQVNYLSDLKVKNLVLIRNDKTNLTGMIVLNNRKVSLVVY